MSDRMWMIGRLTSVALASAALAVGAFAGAVSAGESQPTAEAAATCVDDQGFIEVAIIDDFSTTYDVYIDDEVVDEDVTDSDEDVYTYGPYEDGTYTVVVYWIDGDEDILDVDVTVDCTPEETTTTTAAPTTTTAAPVAAAAIQPRFTG